MRRCPFITAAFLGPMLAICGGPSRKLAADDFALQTFDRQQLTDVYYSEGAHAGDLNGDRHADVVYGPYWFAGPDFTTKYEIYEPVPQDREKYADCFFSWIYDFNGDDAEDVFVVGFPGTPAFVYKNPGPEGHDAHWPRHQVLDWVSNESPQLTNLVGDQRPELVCTRDGYFGFATLDWEKPFGNWKFHPVSEQVAAPRFGHGLGVGDVNGDGRLDILHAKGWLEQPARDVETSRWRPHDVSFSPAYGGAEMYAYDVDGDGDNDIITSHAAHDFGLAWYEQTGTGDATEFRPHLIMGEHPSENRYGVLFSELHSVALADMDGDGLKDIITGKTYFSHHRQSPQWDAGAVVYWFRLVRGDDGVDWVPYQADADAGIGRQVSIADVDADGLPDIVLGGMKGAHVLRHRQRVVDRQEWEAAQPSISIAPAPPATAEAELRRGPPSAIGGRDGRVAGALEGESLQFRTSGGQARTQKMSSFSDDLWSGNAQLWWTGARPGDVLTLELPPRQGRVDLEVVMTCAKDYGIVQLSLNDQPLGKPIDLYSPNVVTSGVLRFSNVELTGDEPTLGLTIVGANPKAVRSHMVGVDYVRLGGAGDTQAEEQDGFKAQTAAGKTLSLDFESGTLDEWQAVGEAFSEQPVQGDTVASRRPDMRSGHRGEYWLGGFEALGDQPTGSLISQPFVINRPFATFLFSGGRQAETRVELVRRDSGNAFFRLSGENSELLKEIVVDVRTHMGQEVFIRLIDGDRGGWGHVNFDHFRLHDKRPGPVTRQAVELAADEYPHSGLTADEAAKAMRLPEGFRVTVGASEPDVEQPIAMALDDRGRVWIAEAYEYPIRANGDIGRDRILIFEDTNGDGRLDHRKVFAEGLNLVSGLEVGFGGVWVGAAPYLLFIPDSDRDDVPDGPPQVLLDGWGFQDTHETLNAFIWGPDGWLYGCHGVFTHSRVGKPGTPDEERTPLNAGIWRYHPTRHVFEVFAHGTSNPWGVDFNDQGQAFATACVIPHLFHIIQGARYQRQAGSHFNPHTYRDIPTIADHLHYLGATPHGGNDKSNEAGGGHAHAGAMIYLADAWPAGYRNQLFMNNIHGQRLNMDLLRPEGSGYIGSHGPDFLLTGDRASQILNLRYGSDGNAWMIDWYDMQACHRREVEQHDRSNGRIYKISYDPVGEDAEDVVGAVPDQPETPLPELGDAELAELMLAPNDWYVRHARRLLQERAAARPIDATALQRLQNLATTHADETRRLRAAWTLHVVGGLNQTLAFRLLDDAGPYVRGWAIQLLLEPAAGPLAPPVLSRLTALAESDASPVVRLYLASALQRIPLQQRWPVLEALTAHASDADDHNLPLMYWYAAEPLADIDPERALAFGLSAGENIPALRDFMMRRIGSGDTRAALALLVGGLERADDDELQLTYLKALRAALRGQRRVPAPSDWQPVSEKLRQSDNDDVRLQALALGATFGDPSALSDLRHLVTQDSEKVERRREALDALVATNDPELASMLQSLVHDTSLRDLALRGLAQYDHPETSRILVSAYAGFTPTEKRAALQTLCSRAVFARDLLQAIEQRQIPGTDLTADLVRQLQFLRNEDIDRLLLEVWGDVRETAADKVALIAEYHSLLESPGRADEPLGRAIFSRTCQRCHTLYGVGEKVGPDLTGSNRANLEYLLSNIVDPSAVMAREYRQVAVLTDDGRVVTGIVQEEDDRSVTIRTAEGTVIVPQSEIAERIASDKSMMPDDQLKPFSEYEIRSLFAYLQSRQQTPLRATPENAPQLFNGRDLSGWQGDPALWRVEHGEIVGSTQGLKRNAWLTSDLDVSDFRLTLDVKLVDNAGNSGIQFRSRAAEGIVSGYQADVGAGWWGKLYEEHGRGLLWDRSGEMHVKRDDWNRYEIRAQGGRIQTLINDQLCVDLDDPEGAQRGIIALQLHSGGPTEVRFRNLSLEVLDESPLSSGQADH